LALTPAVVFVRRARLPQLIQKKDSSNVVLMLDCVALAARLAFTPNYGTRHWQLTNIRVQHICNLVTQYVPPAGLSYVNLLGTEIYRASLARRALALAEALPYF
jgi:hypothetical protein